MIPRKLTVFAESLKDKEAYKKLITKITELSSDYDQHTQYITKIVYYIDKETKIARLILSNLTGKQSFEYLSGDIEQILSENHEQEKKSGQKPSILLYGIVLKDFLDPYEINLLDEYNSYCQKKIATQEAKKMIQNKYKIGDIILLKGKIRDGSRRMVKKFIVKKIIWSINSRPVNIVVVQQIEGPVNNLSLTKFDCKKYHIKYEENLQVYSMFMNFVKLK